MNNIQGDRAARTGLRVRRVVTAVAVVLVFLFVPLFPHMPNCEGKTGPTRIASIILSDIYRKELVNGLRIHEIAYLHIDGVVLLRLWDWFDSEDWVLNISNKSILNLVEESWGAVEAELPEHVKALVAESRARYDGRVENTCELVRAVAVEGW